MLNNRRSFITALGSLSIAGLLLPENLLAGKSIQQEFPIASNEYSWITFYKRMGRDWLAELDTSFEDLAKSGIRAYEPSIKNLQQLKELAPLLRKYSIEMPSIYIGCTLHKQKEARESHELIMSLARAAKPMGVRIIVTNPSPVRWGSTEEKSDEELILQADNLDLIGADLCKMGITLAFHNHDKEMQSGAREFHHMMLGTNPENVALCLEAHWLFRGSGDSQVALFDILKLYGSRIAVVHLRQSKKGIWSETFSEGDIDYKRLASALAIQHLRPHLVLEQCIEKESPNTLDPVTAHKEDLKYAQHLFGQV